MELTGQVAVITGAGTGIGRATAIAMAGAVAAVVAAARTAADIEATIDEVRAAGGRGMAIATDVTDEGQVDRLVERSLGEYGRIDVLNQSQGETCRVAAVGSPARERAARPCDA